jgi:IclR family transcriptional regulator, pca regulon regulatory protein
MNRVTNEMRNNPLFATTLEKGLRILRVFYDANGPLGLSDLCRATGLEKSAVQRLTHTLAALGYLMKDKRTKRYYPAARLLDFSFMYLQSDPLIQAAGPHLLDAKEEAQESVNLGTLDATDVVYIYRLPSSSARIISPIVGARSPAFCTATGRAILSRLPENEAAAILDASDRSPLTSNTITDRDIILRKIEAARREGFTIAIQECLPGETTVAAPILNADDRSIGAVNISITTDHWDENKVRKKLAPIVIRAALAISRTQGYALVATALPAAS